MVPKVVELLDPEQLVEIIFVIVAKRRNPVVGVEYSTVSIYHLQLTSVPRRDLDDIRVGHVVVSSEAASQIPVHVPWACPPASKRSYFRELWVSGPVPYRSLRQFLDVYSW